MISHRSAVTHLLLIMTDRKVSSNMEITPDLCPRRTGRLHEQQAERRI